MCPLHVLDAEDDRDRRHAGDEPIVLAERDAGLPTQGRAIDHIGFDVEDLDTVVDMLEARGVALDGPVRRLPGTTVQSVFLTDPWGTRIELTEGLARR